MLEMSWITAVLQLCSQVTDLFGNVIRPKKEICVFPVTRPTLIFRSDPKVFIGIQKTETLSYTTYPICGHF